MNNITPLNDMPFVMYRECTECNAIGIHLAFEDVYWTTWYTWNILCTKVEDNQVPSHRVWNVLHGLGVFVVPIVNCYVLDQAFPGLHPCAPSDYTSSGVCILFSVVQMYPCPWAPPSCLVISSCVTGLVCSHHQPAVPYFYLVPPLLCSIFIWFYLLTGSSFIP